jgi:hypothetical protein
MRCKDTGAVLRLGGGRRRRVSRSRCGLGGWPAGATAALVVDNAQPRAGDADRRSAAARAVDRVVRAARPDGDPNAALVEIYLEPRRDLDAPSRTQIRHPSRPPCLYLGPTAQPCRKSASCPAGCLVARPVARRSPRGGCVTRRPVTAPRVGQHDRERLAFGPFLGKEDQRGGTGRLDRGIEGMISDAGTGSRARISRTTRRGSRCDGETLALADDGGHVAGDSGSADVGSGRHRPRLGDLAGVCWRNCFRSPSWRRMAERG